MRHSRRSLPLIGRPYSHSWWALALLWIFIPVALRAGGTPDSITFDLPIQANLATPSWLGHPVTPPATFATLQIPVLAPDASSSLLVTVYFQEKEGGFMRISWDGTQGARQLCANFYEGIGMANQRSLLIPAKTLVADGTLTFQCDSATLGIQRIKLELLEEKGGLVSPRVQDVLVTPSTGQTLTASSLDGQPPQNHPAVWQNQFVDIPLVDQAVRVEQGVEFSVDLDQVPILARIALKEAGLSLHKHLAVWINQQRAGTISPSVPDLSDQGYSGGNNGSAVYIGWRDGFFFAPVKSLKTGINTIQFEAEDDVAEVKSPGLSGADEPLALKKIDLQLGYPAAAQETVVSNSSVSDTQPPLPVSTPAGNSTVP